jgi:hypothetical protein
VPGVFSGTLDPCHSWWGIGASFNRFGDLFLERIGNSSLFHYAYSFYPLKLLFSAFYLILDWNFRIRLPPLLLPLSIVFCFFLFSFNWALVSLIFWIL